MLALLAQLGMGASPLAAPAVTTGQQAIVLETAATVNVRRSDFTLRSTREGGVQFSGVPEDRYRREFSLTWTQAQHGVRTHLALHHRKYVAGGRAPFRWVYLGEEITVQYAAPPRMTARGRQGGAASVTLIEVLITD